MSGAFIHVDTFIGLDHCQRPSFCGSGPLSVILRSGVSRGALIIIFVIMPGVRS